jgi:hypothetical protein
MVGLLNWELTVKAYEEIGGRVQLKRDGTR